jgi:hypothetical protein
MKRRKESTPGLFMLAEFVCRLTRTVVFLLLAKSFGFNEVYYYIINVEFTRILPIRVLDIHWVFGSIDSF